jgi:WW domain
VARTGSGFEYENPLKAENTSLEVYSSLPSGWESYHDDDGTEYFFNKHTKETTWSRPTESAKTLLGDDEAKLDMHSISKKLSKEVSNRSNLPEHYTPRPSRRESSPRDYSPKN